MDEDREAGRSGGGGRLIVVLLIIFLLPVLYVLSIGPVARLEQETGFPSVDTLRIIYAPVVWLYHHTFLDDPIDWYVALWVDLD